jgi:DNA-binding NarL/FixJ family response regulator
VIRVALADDQALVRMGLRALVDREPDLTVVGEADSGQSTLDLLAREHPDVLLLDVRMPGMDGLEALRRIAADPDLGATRVIVVTTFEIDRYIFAALQAGAGGFILKDSAPEELIRAIRVVAAGDALLSPSVTRRIVATFAARERPRPLDELTDRERELVAWVGTGLSNEDIAAELSISPATVRTHVGRAMVKLGARNRAQLVVIAVSAGLDVPRPRPKPC